MKILIAEDDPATRRGIEVFLKNQGMTVFAAENGEDALAQFWQNHPDLVLSDVKMPRMGGLELLRRIRKSGTSVPVLIMTAFASVEDAVQAMKNGAEDYLTKPLNLEELRLKLNRIREKMRLIEENRSLRKRLRTLEFPEIIGVSAPMRAVFDLIEKVAADPSIPVMIYGESGTGKELVARTIHLRSARAERPFVAVNCSAIPENLIESELFGYKRGAFTGATRDKFGLFQSAHRGTLFLDEVGEMSPALQAKLLRVLQEGCVKPVGGTEEITVDVRVIGASNRKLQTLVEEGLFREDLFYRLNVMEVTLPPLRERQTDIPLLLQFFAERYQQNSREKKHFSSETLRILTQYDWPGNVRELENAVRVALVTSPETVVRPQDLPDKIRQGIKPPAGEQKQAWFSRDYKESLQQVVEAFDRDFIAFYLREFKGNISRTADAIGLSRVALHKKIRQYGIKA